MSVPDFNEIVRQSGIDISGRMAQHEIAQQAEQAKFSQQHLEETRRQELAQTILREVTDVRFDLELNGVYPETRAILSDEYFPVIRSSENIGRGGLSGMPAFPERQHRRRADYVARKLPKYLFQVWDMGQTLLIEDSDRDYWAVKAFALGEDGTVYEGSHDQVNDPFARLKKFNISGLGELSVISRVTIESADADRLQAVRGGLANLVARHLRMPQ